MGGTGLLGQGAVLDHAGKYTEAIPLFEQARTLFAAGGRVRMEANVSIFLANTLQNRIACTCPLGAPARHAAGEIGLATGVLPRENTSMDALDSVTNWAEPTGGWAKLEQAEAAYKRRFPWNRCTPARVNGRRSTRTSSCCIKKAETLMGRCHSASV